MGTSSSAKGPRPGAPLIPPWAAPLPDEEEPDLEEDNPEQDEAKPPSDELDEQSAADPVGGEPERSRPAALNLSGFRRTLGNAVGGGSGSAGLRRALRSYAKATGGGRVAARRLGSPLRTGARVFGLFSTGTATGPDGRTLTLASLNGLSVRVVVDRIVSVLVPPDGERDKVAAALQDALSTALGGVETFDPGAVTPDVLVDMMVIYLRDVIFQSVIGDSGRAFQRTDDLKQVAQMERELLSLVGQVVNDQGKEALEGAGGFNAERMTALQAQIVMEVWDVWESSQ